MFKLRQRTHGWCELLLRNCHPSLPCHFKESHSCYDGCVQIAMLPIWSVDLQTYVNTA